MLYDRGRLVHRRRVAAEMSALAGMSAAAASLDDKSSIEYWTGTMPDPVVINPSG
jgi:hypothetical protein